MKTRFWFFLLLLLGGALLTGYSSGFFEGFRTARTEAQQILNEFARSTELDTYMKQHGPPEWTSKLKRFGFAGPSYVHGHERSFYAILPGIACIAVGLLGLLPFSRKPCDKPVA